MRLSAAPRAASGHWIPPTAHCRINPILLLIAGLGAGGAVYWFKFRKQKPDTKGPDDLDDYDFGDDDEDDEEEYVIEDDQPEETDEV